MAVQNDNTIVTKGDLKALYADKIAPYLGANMMVNTNNSDYYSTDEKIVGVWIDGKPIYQRTWTWTGAINNSVKSFTAGIGTNVVDNCVALYGGTWRTESGSYTWCCSITEPNATTQMVNAYYGGHNDTINIHCIANYPASTIWNVTMQYTKASDTAGSGVTTPGAYDINFPNTWKENTEIYFGNGLYGYRATGSTSITSGVVKSWDALTITRTANTKIYNYGGTWKRSSAIPAAADTVFGIPLSEDFNVNSGVMIGSQAIILTVKDAFTGTATYDFWFTFTK